MTLEYVSISTVIFLFYITDVRAQPINYLMLVTRQFHGSTTNDLNYLTIYGISEQTPHLQLNAPSVGNSDHSAYGYIRSALDVGEICSVSIYVDGNDGWYIGTVFIKRETDSVFKTFIFNAEVDDRATLTRTLKKDGGWSEWSEWGVCDALCGTHGNQTRYRNCTNPVPYCGGDDCTDSGVGRQSCQGSTCPTTTTTTTTTSPTQSTPQSATQTSATTSTGATSISLGVVLALSVVLNAILVVFLIVVLRDKREDKEKLDSKHDTKFSEIGAGAGSADTVYTNTSMM